MTDINTIKQLFKNPELLDQALTHKSWVNEHPNNRDTNERLEFLGDAILEFITSEAIYLQFPDQKEGYLTALRANIVNTVNLAKVAKKLEVGKHLFLSKGEEDTGGRTNQSLLADTVEAIIGAMYLDRGLEFTSEFIKLNILSDIQDKVNGPLKDAKSRFQEQVQAKSYPTPKYKVISESGPDHSKIFIVGVYIDNKKYGTGKGKSKAEAEQNAAQDALSKFL